MVIQHQFIERSTGRVVTERLFGDRVVRMIYSDAREKAPLLFRALTGKRMSDLLAFMVYDIPVKASTRRHLSKCGADLSECLDAPEILNTARRLFERKIRYWECRPMPQDASSVVSPADSKVIVGSLAKSSGMFLKGKLFHYEELLGTDREVLHKAFQDGDFAVFRLTPDKYHYNHVPVSGTVLGIYDIPGTYHSCNPSAVVALVSPYSTNRRVVTVMDTDVTGGAHCGLVAMIEVAALMIGDVVQCYSDEKYNDPRPLTEGMFVKKGSPKSLFRPGSSTDVLLFQKDRVEFSSDLVRNMNRRDVRSRFSEGFGRGLAETDLKVRSIIGWAKT